MTYEKGKLYQIKLTDMLPDPNQPRKTMDPEALAELSASIGQHGVLIPILFRMDDEGSLVVVAGERRLIAARDAGLTTIPGIFVDGNHAEIALVENLLRQDLTAVEEAEALNNLMIERDYTQEQLANVIGKARSTINDILSLVRLPQSIRDDCRGDKTVARNTLIEIARKKQERGMLTAWNKYKSKLEKQGAEKRKKQKSIQSPEDVAKWLAKTAGNLENLDASGWSPEENEALKQGLIALRNVIEQYLNPQH